MITDDKFICQHYLTKRFRLTNVLISSLSRIAFKPLIGPEHCLPGLVLSRIRQSFWYLPHSVIYYSL